MPTATLLPSVQQYAIKRIQLTSIKKKKKKRIQLTNPDRIRIGSMTWMGQACSHVPKSNERIDSVFVEDCKIPSSIKFDRKVNLGNDQCYGNSEISLETVKKRKKAARVSSTNPFVSLNGTLIDANSEGAMTMHQTS